MEQTPLLEEDTQQGRYLTFTVGHDTFGLEIACVREIVGLQPITSLPDVPEHVKGIINLRGRIIPVIDMCLRLGKSRTEYTDRTCIIVVELTDISVGLIVDQVSEVQTIEDSDIVSPPPSMVGSQNQYIKAIGKTGNNVKLLLDCAKLFGNNELACINQ